MGKRMSIKATRACVDAVLDGSINKTDFFSDKVEFCLSWRVRVCACVCVRACVCMYVCVSWELLLAFCFVFWVVVRHRGITVRSLTDEEL